MHSLREPHRRPAITPRVAIVGTGIAGLTAAHLLDRTHDVIAFERDERPGGHAHTVRVDTPDGRVIGVDTGFIVMNERTYPNLVRMFGDLGVTTQRSEMSMSVRCDGCGLEYAGAKGPGGVFARPRNAASADFLRMLVEIKRFHREGRRALASGEAEGMTVDDFLSTGGYSDFFRHHFLVPLVSCVWSSAGQTVYEYPVRYLLRFLDHHGMLSVTGSPQWLTVTGGSATYVERLVGRLRGEVRTGRGVVGVARDDRGVTVFEAGGGEHRVDHLVLATHPDQALKVLDDPTEEEYRLLSDFPYSRNEAVLHTDGSVLPSRRRARASWNFRARSCEADDAPVAVTYDLNRLQRLGEDVDYCVSLNDAGRIDPQRRIRTVVYEHPIYTPESLVAQRGIAALNRPGARTLYAGAWLGWGFHEDGCRSGVRAAQLVQAAR